MKTESLYDETKSKSMYKYESCKLNNDFVPFEPYMFNSFALQVGSYSAGFGDWTRKVYRGRKLAFPSWKEQNEITFIASFTENLVTNLED